MSDKERAKKRKERSAAKKRKKIGKGILIFLAAIVVTAAAFLITLTVCDPEFEIKSIIENEKVQQAVAFVKEDVFGKTTTELTTVSTTKQTTTKPKNYDYSSFDDFAFDTSLQGNQIGNLLNNTQGAVTYSSAYIYYSIDGKGLYRFEPNGESNSAVNVNNYNFKYLNVLGDYIYLVDTQSHKLKKSQIVGGDMVNVADNISFAYLYNDKIYYIGTDNTIGFINTSDFKKTVLYTAQADKTLNFVGISLSRIFFTQYDKVADYYEYITISLIDSSDKRYFRDDTQGDIITKMQLEGGYFYYYQKHQDGTFDLCRQKFGSDKIVTLIEKCSLTDYPVIYANRLYCTQYESHRVDAFELNMNSMDKKIMLSAFDADESTTIGVGYGYQYVYLFGCPMKNSQKVYKGSCIYTSSSGDNTIVFEDGDWFY